MVNKRREDGDYSRKQKKILKRIMNTTAHP
jgi:hypothetical protein